MESVTITLNPVSRVWKLNLTLQARKQLIFKCEEEKYKTCLSSRNLGDRALGKVVVIKSDRVIVRWVKFTQNFDFVVTIASIWRDHGNWRPVAVIVTSRTQDWSGRANYLERGWLRNTKYYLAAKMKNVCQGFASGTLIPVVAKEDHVLLVI